MRAAKLRSVAPERLDEELRESGILFELNRTVLHPLGLALAVVTDDETGASTGLLLMETEGREELCFGPEDIRESMAALAETLARRAR